MAGVRRWPPARVVSAMQAACGLPDGGEIERAGPVTRLVYRDHGLVRCLTVYPKPFTAGLLQWQVGVGDEEIRSPTTAMWTHYEPAPDLAEYDRPKRGLTGYQWPTTPGALDDELIRDVTRFARQMLWFLADRRDLGRLLLYWSETGDHRLQRREVAGSGWGEPAAGIAQAIIMARVTADPELEEAALALVNSGEVPGRRVGRWAREFRSWSPVDISDLEQLGRQSPEATRREFAKYFPQSDAAQGADPNETD